MSRFRVLIAGGGVAAVETLLALHHLAGRRVEIDLVAPTREFVYAPLTVLEPFGGDPAPRLPLDRITRERGAGHIFDGVASVDPSRKRVRTTSGETFGYDALVVATGARPVEALPGSITFPGIARVDELKQLLAQLVGGQARSVAFAARPEVTWTLPLYELALLTATFLRRRGGPAVELTVVTPERAPLAAFGDRATETVLQILRDHEVRVRTGSTPEEVTHDGIRLAEGSVLPADRVVALPRLVGPDIEGLPTETGFVPVDDHGRVRGVENVYAAGDVTARELKQGGLAAQQGDVVAEAIAERVGAPLRPTSYRPVLRGVMLTGDDATYIRSDRGGDRRRSIVALHPLWWPPGKIAGYYLAPYLAARGISLPDHEARIGAGR
jgi:sulfide:quinone oxidoreductase